MKNRFIALLLIAFSVSLFGCGDDEDVVKVFTINEGEHKSTPYQVRYNRDTYISYEWYPNRTWIYDLGDADQCDQNKLWGVALEFGNNLVNSIMFAWRYDLEGHIQISPYYHYFGSVNWVRYPCTGYSQSGGDEDLVVTGRTSDVFLTTMQIDREAGIITLTCENLRTRDSWTFSQTWASIPDYVWHINPWFGGNETATHDIKMGRREIARY